MSHRRSMMAVLKAPSEPFLANYGLDFNPATQGANGWRYGYFAVHANVPVGGSVITPADPASFTMAGMVSTGTYWQHATNAYNLPTFHTNAIFPEFNMADAVVHYTCPRSGHVTITLNAVQNSFGPGLIAIWHNGTNISGYFPTSVTRDIHLWDITVAAGDIICLEHNTWGGYDGDGINVNEFSIFYPAGILPPPALDPLTLAPAIWLDCSDPSTLFSDTVGGTPSSIGGVVSWITDKSGNGRHFSNISTGTLKLNTYPWLYHVEQISGGGFWPSPMVIPCAGLTMLMVYQKMGGAMNPSRVLDVSATIDGSEEVVGFATGALIQDETTPPQPWKIGIATVPTIIQFGKFIGLMQTLGHIGSPPWTASGYSDNNYNCLGLIGELIIIPRILITAEINALGNYLSSKWKAEFILTKDIPDHPDTINPL